ncbi:hypothetical protein SeMB42_g03778 [Synchytrium endobioticum]|uniref:Uncharacterized protein n=1 Tax=Synchytrium endobioticum TaxID=286115 RepID=A0A507D2X9_9FUNG|nr:hypothetical protein SeLEV6574_g03623 [Synchytrium endobioticum]TPX46265.1 hypothetical protein SeMB42_g03778 [Synchytrium endobioticum]
MLEGVKEASNESMASALVTTVVHDYLGGLRDNRAHGSGVYTWPDATRFEGEFLNGKIIGTGTYTWINGCVYEGEVQDAYRHGRGALSFTNRGGVYSGNWVQGKRSGKGVLVYDYEGRCRYDGDWKNGVRHGFGTMTYASGNIYEGEWRNGSKCGRGIMKWARRNEEYTGEWVDNLPNGLGAYTWKINNISQDRFPGHNRYEGWYDGDWKDNMKHGRGTYTSEDGRKYTGMFENDRMLGEFPAFNNESPFQFRHLDLIPWSDNQSDQHLKTINSVVTRHMGSLRSLYHRLCTTGAKQASPSDDVCGVERVQLWYLFRDCKLPLKGVTLVDLDRVFARGFQQSDSFSPFFADPHTPSASFILRDFIEHLLRVAWLVYGSSSEPLPNTTETGPAAALERLLSNDIFPIVDQVSEVKTDKRETLLKNLSMENEPRYRASLYKMYCNLSQVRKDSLIGSVGDVTMTMRDVVLAINTYGVLSGNEGISQLSSFLSQANKTIAISADYGDSYNLEYEIVSLELFDLIMMAMMLKFSDLVDAALGIVKPAASSSDAQTVDSTALQRSSSNKDRVVKPLRLKTADASAQKGSSGASTLNSPSPLSLHLKDATAKGSHTNIKTRRESSSRPEYLSRGNMKSRDSGGGGREEGVADGSGSKNGIAHRSSVLIDDDEPVTRSRTDVSKMMSPSEAFTAVTDPVYKSPEENEARLKQQITKCFVNIFKYHDEYMRCKYIAKELAGS